MNAAALLDEVTEDLYARHTSDSETAATARREYEERRSKVHQDDELWEAWSAAFVEWYVIERVAPGHGVPLAALTHRELTAANDPRADAVSALITSHRSLFEVRSVAKGKVELLDLLGGAAFAVDEQRALHGVEVGDVAELRLVGVHGEVRFGRTFIYHPKAARAAIVERARAMLAKGASRRDVIDHIAQLRVTVTRYRHMPAARVYELGSRITG
ncbi:MAG: hypothetical protein M4D80_04170 [Myxococcota bacterium]|nr:hypothetical protein [Deltaproteobacteria bacterium]MDQ3334334.1 hypothetical protein [Myxococcota bacterium]